VVTQSVEGAQVPERIFGQTSDGETVASDEIWLLGQPPLRHFLDFVRESAVDGEQQDKAALAAEWRAASDHYAELARLEPGWAEMEIRELGPELAPLVEEVKADPCFRKTFRTMPVRFGMVELDRLVVSQKSVSGNFVGDIQSRLGASPDANALFRFCLPLTYAGAQVHARPVGSKRWVFQSDSTDFRFLEPVLLRPRQLKDYDSCGPVAAVVALVVGFGSNFLNVLHYRGRALLHNGYHRACALRELGITHAPAIIQTVTRKAELDYSAKASVADNPEYYFEQPRPPVLKDFFDPKIRKVVRVHKLARMIEVNFEVKDYTVAK
jgi:hypothetical protein